MGDPYIPPQPPPMQPDWNGSQDIRIVPDKILGQIKYAWIAGLFSAGATILMILISAGNPLGGTYDAWELIDVGLILLLSFGVYRKSRICAVSLFSYFLISKIAVLIAGGSMGSSVMGILFLYFYFQGILGTFKYHSYMPKEEDMGISKGIKSFFWIAGGGVVALVVIVLSVLVYIGTVGPDTFIVSGQQMNERFVTTIQDLEVLEEGEQILFFYSDALLDIEEGFYLLTDRKVLVYSAEWVEPAIPVRFDEIEDLDVVYDESFFVDSRIMITLKNGDYVTFPVSSEQGGDKKFFAALEKSWKEAAN